MSLFEIEINDNFKILNREVFLKKDEFEKYYKLNNLNDGYRDDISEYLLNNISLQVRHDCSYMCSIQQISMFVVSSVYELNNSSEEKIFYPEWLLFLIAIQKKQVQFITEDKFRTYMKYFKFIAEIRYKRYIIRNIRNYIKINKLKNAHRFQQPLENQLCKHIKNFQFENLKIYDFLNFLYDFHDRLKEKEKYKLMWNLEVYIMETVKFLIKDGISVEEIYKKSIRRGTNYSYLNQIQKYRPLYIRENQNFFKSHLLKINQVFELNMSIETLMDIFLSDEKYENILFYYMELIKRLNSSKISEDTMGTIIKGIVLGIEEYIKDAYNCTKLYDCIKKSHPNSHKFNDFKNKVGEHDSNIIFFNKFDKLISEETSVEKYLMIYYHARNYLAHNNIDMDKFFWGEDGKRTVIINVMDSVMMVLYKLATLK